MIITESILIMKCKTEFWILFLLPIEGSSSEWLRTGCFLYLIMFFVVFGGILHLKCTFFFGDRNGVPPMLPLDMNR